MKLLFISDLFIGFSLFVQLNELFFLLIVICRGDKHNNHNGNEDAEAVEPGDGFVFFQDGVQRDRDQTCAKQYD